MKNRVIVITGCTETLEYFSLEIATYMYSIGKEVFVWDMKHPLESMRKFESMPNKEDSTLISFNFIGLSMEGQFSSGGRYIWDEYNIEKICIMVDSPIYYYRQLSEHFTNIQMVCIDRYHADFMRRWYPEYGEPLFIPLAGNFIYDTTWTGAGIACNINKECSLKTYTQIPRLRPYSQKPLKDRNIDLMFMGNFVPFDSILTSLDKAPQDYRDYVMSIIDEMIQNPDKPLELELEDRLHKDFADEADETYPEVMFHMVSIDLYVRSYFRGNMIKDLAEAGYRIFCVGQDWDKLSTNAHDNIYATPNMCGSLECLRVLEDTKISLNIMPWFKSGAHDRIFSSMLAGCTSVTDSSEYLSEILVPWHDYAPFTLSDNESLFATVDKLLIDGDLAQQIADTGRQKALSGHTWDHFAKILIDNTK